MAVMKIETELNTCIVAVLMYAETFKTDVIVNL